MADEQQPPQSALSWLWDHRPWKGHADKPVDTSTLMIALGLLGPRGVGNMSARDLVMARQMSRAGDLPAAVPPDMPMPMGRYPGASSPNMSVGPHGMLGGQEGMSLFPDQAVHRMLSNMSDVRLSAGNINNRQSMTPDLRLVGGNEPAPTQPNMATFQGRMTAYDNYIRGLPEGQHPMSYQSFLRQPPGLLE